MSVPFREPADHIIERLEQLRETDAPTHGGSVLSYVYDPGVAEIDALAARAIAVMQPVNGLDPTTFRSVAALERDIIGFLRPLLGADEEVVGTVTTGGTESCLLAVKTARDLWVRAGGVGTPRLLMPVTTHAAFAKAAHYFGLTVDAVPVDPDTGAVVAQTLIERMGPDVALVVVSAPSYPFAAIDPVAEVAAAAAARGIACHSDACIGGMALAFLDDVPDWDFRVPGVTSVSIDLHKYGYAPKGASVLLQRGRDRQRAQFFATSRWPGYPVVNATMLGSKSAGPLAAAWAIIQLLGEPGFRELSLRAQRATQALIGAVRDIEGLRVIGDPIAPLFAVAMDESVPEDRRVDPHQWADQVLSTGWQLQLQPGHVQTDGTVLPRTTHLTVTPVTLDRLDELIPALTLAAEAVRGRPAMVADLPEALGQLPLPLSSEHARMALAGFGLLGEGSAGLPGELAPLLALIEALPSEMAERLLIELIGSLSEPL